MKIKKNRDAGKRPVQATSPKRPVRPIRKKPDNRLVLEANLLPWYDEINDHLDVKDAKFPLHVRKKIELFGEYEIDTISRNRTILLRKQGSENPRA